MLHSRYVIIVIICWSCVTISEAIVRNEDICGIQNGRRLYLELGEQGVLYAKNVSFIKNAPRLQDSRIYTTNSSHDQCSLELVTCPSCVITLTFKSIGLSQNCGDGSFMLDSSCRCDYVWISEPPYEDVSGTPFCGFYSPISYRSNTRTLSITLLYSQSHNHAFTLEYTSERNRINLKGSDISSGIGKSRNNTIGGILTSPFFPSRYPRDLGMEYVITCPTEAPSCRVRVLFSDFQLAAVSIIEFYDWNGQRLDVSSGVRFRPPVIVSSGPSLLIRFYANGGTGLGYKAFYSFVLGHLYDKSVQPITDCGGYVENLGGAITMMDMVDEGVKIYDCVWLIRPPKTFLQMKTHVYLKIITFDDMAGSTELIIKQGPTSALLPLEILRHPASKLQPRRLKEHIAPIISGFHVSLRGTFGPTSRLAMAYTTFSYTDCFTGSDFLCQNHRCIPSHLNCDGFDHCGDNSDEPSTCVQDWELAPQDRKWHTNKANYYFPKIDQYPDLKTATLVFVASSLGLITLISALIVLLYRMGARARQQRELQSRLQTISELLDGARIEEVTVTDDPPDYESPPGYEEVVKLSLENEHKKRKKKKSNSSCRLNRNCNDNYLNDNEANGSSNIPADDGASTSDCVFTNECSVQQTVPESPPPPYITPPGTIASRMKFFALSDSSCVADGFTSNGEPLLEQSTTENSRSLPISEPTTPELSSSTTDAELLGGYLQNYPENQTESSTSQLSSWRDASMNINPEFEARSKDVVVDGPEDKKTKKCSRRDDDPERGPSTSSSSSAPSEVELKKTAKPRSKKRDKNKVLTPVSSENSLPNSTTISSSSSLIASQVLPIVTASSSAEGINSSTLNIISNRTSLNPSSQISSPTQTSLISSIKTSLNFPPQTSLMSSIKTSLNSPAQTSLISSIKSSLNTLSEASTNHSAVLKNPVSNTRKFSPSANITSISSNFTVSTRGERKNLPKCSTIVSSPSEVISPPKTSSTPVETHSKKLKCVLTSCAVASSSIEATNSIKSLSASSTTAVSYSKKISPIPTVKTSSIPSAKVSLVKAFPNSSSLVKDASVTSTKDTLTSAAKGSSRSLVKTSLSTKASSSNPPIHDSTIPSVNTLSTALIKATSTSAEKILPSTLPIDSQNTEKNSSASKLKASTSYPVKISSSSSIKKSSLPTEKSSLLTSVTSNKPISSPTVSLISSNNESAFLSTETNTKHGIIKLLGNSKITNNKSPSKMIRNYSSPSSSSSPASTIGKSFMRNNNYSRKFSNCSHDSYATKLSALSASSSYEKLNDDFEILSEYSSTYDSNSPNNTPFNTPKIHNERSLSLAQSCANNQCSKCDLESLYEGIRILDSFIARREKDINNCTRNSSRATTHFGTPSHFSKRDDNNYYTIERKRFSSSTTDVDNNY
ncbi:uncharacterized protein LOC127288463 isoform X2 [Leptopilina boulardi]|uniref:uncharacterized protein LOC127288463 isoform X2 n=1 Tax=Leptopilina boulardi TaxID=63433 RepID=UPI0021F65F78|nr:uncharacterized protein LOC127288463 isoform X2 [Leptopilina boulardi]